MPKKVTANGKTFTFDDNVTDEQIGQTIDEYFASNPVEEPVKKKISPTDLKGGAEAFLNAARGNISLPSASNVQEEKPQTQPPIPQTKLPPTKVINNIMGATSFLERDIAQTQAFSMAGLAAMEREKNPYSIQSTQKKNELAPTTLEKFSLQKNQILNNPSVLKEYNKKRQDEVNSQLNDLSSKKDAILINQQHSRGRYSDTYKAMLAPIDAEIDRLTKEKENLIGSVVTQATKLLLPKFATDLKTFNPEVLGREITEIADPNLAERYKLIESSGKTLPNIQKSILAKTGLTSVKNYLEANPNTESGKELKKVVDEYDFNFDVKNPELTSIAVRDKIAAYLYNKYPEPLFNHWGRWQLEEAVQNAGLTDGEKKVALDYTLPLEDKLLGTSFPMSGVVKKATQALEKTYIGAGRTIGKVFTDLFPNAAKFFGATRTTADQAYESLDYGVEQKYANVGENAEGMAALKQLTEKEKTEGLSKDEIKKKKNLEKYVGVRSGWSELGDLTGDMTGQVLALGSIAKVLGVVGSGLRAFGAGGGLLTGGTTSGAIGAALTNDTVGLYLSSYLMAKDSYDKQAIELMPRADQKEAREWYASTMSFFEGATEGIFNDKKVVDAIIGAAKPSVKEVSLKLLKGDITREIAQQELRGIFKTNALKFGKSFLVSTVENASEESVMDGINDIGNSLFAGTKFDIAKTGEKMLQTFYTTAISSGVIAGMAAKGDLSKDITQRKSFKNAIGNMAVNPTPYLGAVEDLLLSGEITQQEANEKIKLIKSANVFLKEMPTSRIVENKNKKGEIESTEAKGFSYQENVSYILHRMNEGVLNEKIETEKKSSNPDTIVLANLEKELKRSIAIRKGIYDGDVKVDETINEGIADNKKAQELGIADHTAYYEKDGKVISKEEAVALLDNNDSGGLVIAYDEELQKRLEKQGGVSTPNETKAEPKKEPIEPPKLQNEKLNEIIKTASLPTLKALAKTPNLSVEDRTALNDFIDRKENPKVEKEDEINKPKTEEISAVIEVGGKMYEGKNHAEAILKAQADGQDISQVNRQAEGKFKLSDGTIIDRAEAKKRFGQDRSELLIEQDEAANQANKDYAAITKPVEDKEVGSNSVVEGVKLKGEEGLSYLLEDKSTVGAIGKESGDKINDGVSVYTSENGSFRYVKYENGKPIAAIQIMSRDGKRGIVANVYTNPELRRKGIATELLNIAKKDFQNIQHSPLGKSELGDAFAKADKPQSNESSSNSADATLVSKNDGGNSVGGDVENKVNKIADEYLYHGTGEGAFRRIREEGLVPQGDKYLYFADIEQYAKTYAQRKGNSFGDRVLRVKKSDAYLPDENTTGGDFKIKNKINPSDIEIKHKGKWISIQDFSDENIGIMPIPKAVEQSLKEQSPISKTKTTDVGGVTTPDVSEALKDAESTAKALEGVGDKLLDKETPLIEGEVLKTEGLPDLDIVGSKEANQALESEIGGDVGVIDNNVRYIPIQEYDVVDNKRSNQIAEQIEENGYIEPLIVSYDKNGVYIVEGQHRAGALQKLGYDKAPVIVIYEPSKINRNTAEAYHKAKADGTNPELVKAVEQSLPTQSKATVKEEEGDGEQGAVEVKSNKDVSKVFNRLLKDEHETDDYGIHGLLADWGAEYNPDTERLVFNDTRSSTGKMNLSKKEFINDILSGKLEKEVPDSKYFIEKVKASILDELGVKGESESVVSKKEEKIDTKQERVEPTPTLTEVEKLEQQRDNEIAKAQKPKVKLDLMSSEELINFKKSVDKKIKRIKNKYEKLINKEKGIEPEEKLFTGNAIERADAKRTYKEFNRTSDEVPPTDGRMAALEYLAQGHTVGGHVIDEVAGTVKRARLNTGEREFKSSEAKARSYYDANNKSTLDEIVHGIWEAHNQEIDEQDIKNELMDVILTFNTRLEAAKEYIKSYSSEAAEREMMKRFEEEHQQQIEQEEKDITAWMQELGEKEFDFKESDEYVNTIINKYENEYQAEIEQSPKGSTSQSNKGIGGEESSTTEQRGIDEETKQQSITEKIKKDEREKYLQSKRAEAIRGNEVLQRYENYKKTVPKSISEDAKFKGFKEEVGNDFVIDNIDTKLGEEDGNGTESLVWLNEDGISVTKAMSYDLEGGIDNLIDKIIVHNSIFPKTKIEILGVGTLSDGINVLVVNQPLVLFKEDSSMSKGEIDDFMASKGFEPITNEEYPTYSNGVFIINDLHEGNIGKTPQGNVAVIDFFADILQSEKQTDLKTKKQEIESVKPIRQLGTGANVYFETNKYRVNENLKDGKILLNVGDANNVMTLGSIKFDSPNEAVFVAKKLQENAPQGLDNGFHNVDKIIENYKKEYEESLPVKDSELLENAKKEEQFAVDKKRNKSFKEKANQLADKIDEVGLNDALGLPSAKIDGVKKAGFDMKVLDKIASKAIRLVGDLVESGIQLKDAIEIAFADIKEYLDENLLKYDEKTYKDAFKEKVKEEYSKSEEEHPSEAKKLADQIKKGNLNREDVIKNRSEEFVRELDKHLYGSSKFNFDDKAFKTSVKNKKDFGFTKEQIIEDLAATRKPTKRLLQIIDDVFGEDAQDDAALKEIKEDFENIAKGRRPKAVLKKLADSDVSQMVKELKDVLSYQPISNKQLEDIADYIVAVSDIDNALDIIKNLANENLDDAKQVVRAKLIVALQESGNIELATQLVEDMANDAVQAGRQSQSLIKAYEILGAKGSPLMKTAFQKKYIEKVNQEADKRVKNLLDKYDAAQDEIKKLNEQIHEKTQNSSMMNKMKDLIEKLCGLRNKK